MANIIQPSFMTAPTFNGENYDFWSIKMKTFFCSQDLWKIVDSDATSGSRQYLSKNNESYKCQRCLGYTKGGV